MPLLGRVSQEDSDLTILNAPGSPRILPPHACALGPLFQETSFVNHQNSIFITQMLHHILTQIISDLVRAPHGATEEMLRGIRGLVPGLFRELPAILSLHEAEQSAKVRHRPLAQFRAREPVTDQGGNFSEFLSPA